MTRDIAPRPAEGYPLSFLRVKIFYCDHFVLPLPPGHRFPMEKYSLLRKAVTEAGLVPPGDLRVPAAATDADLGRVHTREYIRRVKGGRLERAEVRRVGFPWSPELVERSLRLFGEEVIPQLAGQLSSSR